MTDDYNQITKTWRSEKPCKKRGIFSRSLFGDANTHWAYYVFRSDEEKDYWLATHADEVNRRYWRHWDFMSLPCQYCGAYSPLRAQTQFSDSTDYTCKPEEVVDHHPGEEHPPNIRYYKENGWGYYYFTETLSDSLEGQATFRLKFKPDDEQWNK